MNITFSLIFFFALIYRVLTEPSLVRQYHHSPVSAEVFESLEELARIVDISYCVGNTGITWPFQCLGRCSDFKGFELVTTWNTGPLLSDSCGYIALSHEPFEKRVIVAFRGTYSIANTIADLTTRHAEFIPFPASDDPDDICEKWPFPSEQAVSLSNEQQILDRKRETSGCENCTIHSGFLASWQNARCLVLPHVKEVTAKYPDYKLVLVGHSLGGAVAAIAGLELQARGCQPHVTTFGEPRLGNREMNQHINRKFNLSTVMADESRFRRVTHVDDPVPLLPLEEWGYEMHSGEIFIAKPSLPPSRKDVWACIGDSDPGCIAGSGMVVEVTGSNKKSFRHDDTDPVSSIDYRFRQVFFAHRDYFWRLGLCVPSVFGQKNHVDEVDFRMGDNIQAENSDSATTQDV